MPRKIDEIRPDFRQFWSSESSAEDNHFRVARIRSISSMTRFTFCSVSRSGSPVVMSTPASFSSSIGYLDPPAARNFAERRAGLLHVLTELPQRVADADVSDLLPFNFNPQKPLRDAKPQDSTNTP